MKSGRVATFAYAILMIQALGASAQAPRAAPPAPTPPSGAEGQKATGDALAQEAEVKPKDPEDKDEKDGKKKEKRLTGTLAAGLTFTSGNSNTRTLNLALALEYRPNPKDRLKAEGFYIQNREDGTSTVDRTSAHLREERSLAPLWFAYGDLQFLKDRFKQINSLFAPTAGLGRRLIASGTQELSVDLGAGAVIEQDEGLDRQTSGALRAGETYLWKISKSAVLTQNAFALWKTRDTADAYYHFEVALGAAINDHLELRVALLDEYKREVHDPTLKKNDVAGIVSVGYKL
jgi:putative salt-induced outer membrane protein YdiY